MPYHQYAASSSAAVGACNHWESPNQPDEVVKSSQHVSSKSLFCQNEKLKIFDIMMHDDSMLHTVPARESCKYLST